MAALRATGRAIYPINPLAASRYRARYAVSDAKSDATDVVPLANIVRPDAGAHSSTRADTELAQPIRVLARAKQDAVWSRLQIGNQIRDVLKDFCPAELAAFADGGLAQRDTRMVRTAAPSTVQAVKLIPARLRRMAINAGRKRYSDRLRRIIAATYLHQPPIVENVMGIQLTAPLGELDAACAAANKLAEAATDHLERHPDTEFIISFAGLGTLTAAQAPFEIGDDGERFADDRGLKACT